MNPKGQQEGPHNLPYEHRPLKLLQPPHPQSLVRVMEQRLTRLIESLCPIPSPSDICMGLSIHPPVSSKLLSNRWLGSTPSLAPMTKNLTNKDFYQVPLTSTTETEGHPIA